VADPPSYQKGSFVATKDYVKVICRLPSLVTPGGHALLCLNAPELEESFSMDLVTKEAPPLELVQRLPNPPTFPTKDPSRALKILLYRNTQSLEENKESDTRKIQETDVVSNEETVDRSFLLQGVSETFPNEATNPHFS
jgi:hypothetical protein